MSARYGSRTRTGEAVSGFGQRGAGTAPLAPISATGGEIIILTNHIVHRFVGSGDFTVLSGSTTIGYAIVAGGGGGGTTTRTLPPGTTGGAYMAGGAGGAGGVLSGTAPVTPGTYPIVIGAGGAADTNGSNSTAFSQTATGGGYGGGGSYTFPSPGATILTNGNPGGSGGSFSAGLLGGPSPFGGSSRVLTISTAGNGTPGQGNAGVVFSGGAKSPLGKSTPLVSLAPPALPLAPSANALNSIMFARGGVSASSPGPIPAGWFTTVNQNLYPAGVANTGDGGNATANMPAPGASQTIAGTAGGSGVVYVWYARV